MTAHGKLSVAALQFISEHLDFGHPLEPIDRLSANAVLSKSVVDEIDSELHASSNPKLRIYFPQDLDVASLADWPLATQLSGWKYRGYAPEFVIAKGAFERLDQASKIALHAFGLRFSEPNGVFPIKIGNPIVCNNGASIMATVTSEKGVVAWGSRDGTPLMPGHTWGLPSQHPMVRGTLSVSVELAELDPASLMPLPSAKMIQITNELDRAVTLFGRAMADKIRGALSELGYGKEAEIVSVSYSDPFVRSPLVAKLLIDTVSALYSNTNQQRTLHLATRTPESGERSLPWRTFDDWREANVMTAVTQAYASLKRIDLTVSPGNVPHGRYMKIEFADRPSATIVLDQGFGPWSVSSIGQQSRHDFKASATRQAEEMAKQSAMLSRRGVGSTYLVVTRD